MPLPGLASMVGMRNSSDYFVALATASTSGTSLVVSKPAGTVSGDFMLAVMASGSNGTWTGDTGWTEVKDQAAQPSVRVAYKAAGGAEGSSYTFTSSVSTSLNGIILTYRGLQYDTVGASVVVLNGDGDLVMTGLTAAGGLLLAAVACYAPYTNSVPTGMRLVNDAGTLSIFNQAVEAGATGTRTTTIGGGSIFDAGGILIALKP